MGGRKAFTSLVNLEITNKLKKKKESDALLFYSFVWKFPYNGKRE